MYNGQLCFHRWYDHPDAIGRNGTGRLELPRPVSVLWRAETVEQEKLVMQLETLVIYLIQ